MKKCMNETVTHFNPHHNLGDIISRLWIRKLTSREVKQISQGLST